MEQTRFDFTPEQKALLVALSRETGKPIPALLDAALEALLEHAHRAPHREDVSATPPPPPSPLSVLEIFQEARAGIPEKVWKALPEDLAAQHDHYIYGIPKRTQ